MGRSSLLLDVCKGAPQPASEGWRRLLWLFPKLRRQVEKSQASPGVSVSLQVGKSWAASPTKSRFQAGGGLC